MRKTTRTTNTTIKRYSELITLPTFEERFDYLSCDGQIGMETFGPYRYLVDQFLHSREWYRLRDQVILRDNGCELGIPDFEIVGKIFVHHMNPVSIEDIINRTEFLLNPEYLISMSKHTHDVLHYGADGIRPYAELVERRPNDTCPWRR